VGAAGVATYPLGPVPDLVRLAPDLPDLAALGAEGPEALLAGGAGLVTGDRAEVLRAEGVYTHVRVPRPGTPDASGKRRELPGGAGTGWMRLHLWRDVPLEVVRARLSAPRSTSHAARRWNLACHLLASGVVAPRPLALVERTRGLRTTSVMVEAELEGFEPLPRWLARMPAGPARTRGLRSIALALGALLRSGASLRGCRAEDVLLADDEPALSDCGVERLAALQADLARWRARGLVRARLPAVAFAGLDRGTLRADLAAEQRLAWLAGLERGLEPDSRPRSRERARLALGALADLGSGRATPVRQACRARATASASTAS